jgi:sugar phosphate isomerase/epimerase
VHVKDARKIDGVDHYCYCGEGDGRVPETVADLLATGYDGGISIEPHLAAVIHTGQQAQSADELYRSYTEYGRRLMAIVEAAQAATQ